VFLIVLENHSYTDIVGSPDAPYLNRLVRTAGLAANYWAVAHPSEPNYLALATGSTQGVTSDSVTHVRARSLADEVSVRSYMQSYGTQLYALKHDPFAVLGLRSEDYAGFAHDPLAQVTLIVPDLCHDMHGAPQCSDGSVLMHAADAFTRAAVGKIERRDPHALIFVTFDEGSGDNHVLTLVVGGRHAVSDRRYDHYSLLRTIEAQLGVPCLARACSARVMSDLTG
jgi:hypothetical protein